MKYINSLIIIFSLFTLTVYAEDDSGERFPKTGSVKEEGAAVKAGDNANFETLCTLSKADSVKIIARRYSWFKVLLPRKAYVYVNKDYVDLTADEKGIGVVNANNVNLRAGSGTRFSIVGQISKPEKVSILSEDNGWYKIEPPYGTAGWVYSNQIAVSEKKNAGESNSKEAAANLVQKESKEVRAQDSTASVQKKEKTVTNVRLNASYPMAPKGNLSISNPTKNTR